MRRIFLRGMTTVALLVFSAGVTWGSLNLAERSTKSKGSTTITWDSSFHDMDYTLGNVINVVIDWDVDLGAATYDGFALRRYTPKSKKDPADGTPLTVTYSGGNSVSVSFSFNKLHYDQIRNVEVGNAHLKLFLMIDENGDGNPETRVGYGVNVHVEDPQ